MPEMSVSADLAVAPSAAPHPRTRPPSPYLLPLHALRLLGRCALPLTLWFAAGEAVRFGLLHGAAVLAQGDWYQARVVAVVVLLTLVVLTALVTTAGMLHALRGALWETAARRAAGEGHESLIAACRRAALVFVCGYAACGLLGQDHRDLVRLAAVHRPDGLVGDAAGQADGVLGRGLTGLSLTVALAVTLAAFVLKWLFAARYRRHGGRFAGGAAVCCELVFVLYAVVAVVAFVEERSDWAARRVAVVETRAWLERAMAEQPALATAGEWLGAAWPAAVAALLVPLVWLIVALLVYGAYPGDGAGFAARDREPARPGREPDPARRGGRSAQALRERWGPLRHALRLTAQGGAPLFGLFALCFVGVRILGEYLFRAGRYLLGAEEPYRWLLTDPPLQVVTEYAVTVLVVCLAAAAFDLAATRRRTAAEAAPERPVSA